MGPRKTETELLLEGLLQSLYLLQKGPSSSAAAAKAFAAYAAVMRGSSSISIKRNSKSA
ncbi:hypothetical protein ETH_00042980, partial [Eimeria tenella]